jgi:subtilase family serine protease
MKNRLSQLVYSLAVCFLSAASMAAADRQTLAGTVPRAVARLNLKPVGSLPADTQMRLEFSLPFRNNEALGQLLKGVNNQASPSFHRYLTPEQFNEKFAPTAADYQAVISFAQANGLMVTHTQPGRTLVSVQGAVADVEKALHVTLRLYPHPTEARQFYAPDAEPSLDLAVPILAISGLNNYVTPHSRVHLLPKGAAAAPKSGSYNVPGGGTLYMGTDFRHAFASDVTLTGSGQVVGLMELDGFTPDDVTAYENTAGISPHVPVVEVPVNGSSNDPDNGDLEVPLDIEMAIAMAPGLNQVNVYNGRGQGFDAILTEIADPSQGEPLPLQISSSWGNGVDSGTSNLFARFASQGQSYFYAEGDEGALPVDPNGPDGTFINGASPADLEPFMTQVGGTDLSMNGAGVSWQSEIVWGESGPTGGPGGSSGGILSSIPIPYYQRPINMSAVGGSSTLCNVPDVAMPANYILDVCTGTNGVQGYDGVGGTSCAAPLWAGFCALANEQAASEGKPPIGFANPAIYNIGEGASYLSCFHDITNGNNTWSNSPNLYYAYPGFDLCTGWGSPNGQNLINALVGLAGPVFVDFNYTGSVQNGSYDFPYRTLAGGINAVSPGGTIIIRSGGSSSETPTITKSMTIIAQDGSSSVGN